MKTNTKTQAKAKRSENETKRIQNENETEQRPIMDRTRIDGEQAWTKNKAWKENKRDFGKNVDSLVCTTSVDSNKRGLEEGVDLNKAWT